MKKPQHHAPPSLQGLILGLLLALVFAFPAMGGEKTILAASGDRAMAQPETMLEHVVLRQNVMVNDNLILLGDLFEGTGDKAAIAVAYAPEPGKRGLFDANWLYRVANAYDLKWRPLSMKQHVQVKRETVTIERDEIEDHILAALVSRGADREMTLELSNRSLRLHVASSSEAIIEVENASYDPRTHRFSAYVSTPGSKAIRVTGRMQKMLNLPVLSRRMLKNELIRAEDIVWTKSPADRVQNDIILHVDDLIGRTPKRGLRAGALIRSSDVQRPVLVEKGSLVTMILKTPLMVLTSQGRAIDPGADGDVIRITNTQSNKVVQAVVSGSGIASITPASHMAMN